MKKVILMFITAVFFISGLYSQGGVAINMSGATADPSAGLDVQYNNMGFLMPRMTTAERNAIQNPAEGLQIVNITTKCVEIYFSPIWQSMFCACTPPVATAPGTNTVTATQIIWYWVSVNGAAGYKYNTVNDYSTATDNGNVLNFTQSGLTCNTNYTLYVWAYSACGNSNALVINETTSACGFNCGNNITFSYAGSNVTYGTVQGSNSTCWFDRNLGASQVAVASNDINASGDLFQWGRLDDGHQSKTSLLTSTQSNIDVPGHSNFITSSVTPWDWRVTTNNSLWQGVSGINNPCPSGWRIPTETELNNERTSWGSSNAGGAFNNTLKWALTGLRHYDGVIMFTTNGCYWSSTLAVPDVVSRCMIFHGSDAYFGNNNRARGLAVRCIKDY